MSSPVAIVDYAPKRIPITETESFDIWPPSAMDADRLDQIAALILSITYGEMMELAAALWSKRENDFPVTEKELPGIWHRWSMTCQSRS